MDDLVETECFFSVVIINSEEMGGPWTTVLLAVACCAVLAFAVGTSMGLSAGALQQEQDQEQEQEQGNTHCPVTGALLTPRMLSDPALRVEYGGRAIQTCCGSCVAQIKADPDHWFGDY